MNNKTLLKQFNWIAIAEGYSFLILLFIAMPIKYALGNPLPVKYFGWAHGALFILYIWWMIRMKVENDWSIKTTFIAFMAAFLPFGPFLLMKRIHAADQA